MDRKLLFILLAALLVQMQACAEVTVSESSSEKYLRNTGHSMQTVEMVSISKARGTGEEYYTPDEKQLKNSGKQLKFWRKFYSYFDPAAEDYSFFHHDTTTSPSYTDL